jgi:hypothetical protein
MFVSVLIMTSFFRTSKITMMVLKKNFFLFILHVCCYYKVFTRWILGQCILHSFTFLWIEWICILVMFRLALGKIAFFSRSFRSIFLTKMYLLEFLHFFSKWVTLNILWKVLKILKELFTSTSESSTMMD